LPARYVFGAHANDNWRAPSSSDRHSSLRSGSRRNSILDSEWPALKARFERWLDPAHFDAPGRQRRNLANRIQPSPHPLGSPPSSATDLTCG
jgi:hypothetical protein